MGIVLKKYSVDDSSWNSSLASSIEKETFTGTRKNYLEHMEKMKKNLCQETQLKGGVYLFSGDEECESGYLYGVEKIKITLRSDYTVIGSVSGVVPATFVGYWRENGFISYEMNC